MPGMKLGLGLGLSARRAGSAVSSISALSAPIVAGLGGSRVRQAGLGQSGTIYTAPGGVLSWLLALDERVKSANWYDANAATQNNAKSMNGMLFAYDGDSFTQMWRRLPKMLASDANLFFIDLTSNSYQFTNYDISGKNLGTTFSIAGYTDLAKTIVNAIRAAKPNAWIVLLSSFERVTSTGGVWTSGNAPRLLVPQINSAMQAWAATQPGVVFADIRSVLVDLVGSDHEPLATMVRDGTHTSPRGSYAAATVVRDALVAAGAITGSSRLTYYTGSNLVPDFDTTGVAISGVTGASGTRPTGYTLARLGSTNNATLTMTPETRNGKNGFRLDFDTTAMGSNDIEAFTLTASAAITVATANWYGASTFVDAGSWDGFATTGAIVIPSAVGFSGMNAGETPVVGTSGYSGLPLPFANSFTGRQQTYAAKPSSTTGSFALYFTLIKGTSNTGSVWVAEPEYRQVGDPNLAMYDEADVTPLTITSSADISFPEETIPTHQITTNKAFAQFALSGADAALWSVDTRGLMKRLSTPDFETPNDANTDHIDTITITATPFNTSLSAVTQSWTGTCTDIDDGLTDSFTGTDGTDLADYSANWTRVGGATGAMSISGNAAVNNLSIARTAYLFTQQGGTADQEIRVKLPNGPGTTAAMAIRLTDQDNYLALTISGGVPQLSKRVAGSFTNLGNYTLYKTIATNDTIWVQVMNNQVRVYQNGVALKTTGGADYYDVSGVFASVQRAGIVSNASTGSNNKFDNFNNRVAAPIASAIGLYAITLGAATTNTGGNYAGPIVGSTTGSTLTVTSNLGGTWTADGLTLRGASLTSGTHTLTFTETYPGAVNSGRVSSPTVVVP